MGFFLGIALACTACHNNGHHVCERRLSDMLPLTHLPFHTTFVSIESFEALFVSEMQ